MSLLYLVDDTLANIIGRASAPVWTSSVGADVIDSNFPIATIYGRAPWKIARANAAAADQRIFQYGDLLGVMFVFDPGTTWLWTKLNGGTGDSTRTTTAGEYHSSPDAAKLTAGTGFASLYKEVTVRAGELLQLHGWMRASGSGTALMRVQNLKNGKWLTSGLAWSSSASDVFSEAGTSYVEKTATFQVEDIAGCNGWPEVTLRVTAICTGTGVGYFDDFEMVPGVNFVAIYGHNLGPIAPVLQSSDDNSSWTDRIAMTTIARPAFYAYDTSTHYHTYWRLKFTGTNFEPIYLGQLVIGYVTAALQPQNWGWGEDDDWPQVEHTNEAGGTQRYAITDAAARSVTLQFQPQNLTHLEQLRLDLWARSRGGVYPIWIVPMSDRASVAYGRIPRKVAAAHRFQTQQETSLTIGGFPSPIVGV